MTDPSFAAHKSVYNTLVSTLAGKTFLGQVCAVYDAVPQGSAYPYVTIDTQEAAMDDPLASTRDERFFYLTVWSTQKGQQQVLEIIAEIYKSFHKARLLSMDTGRWVRSYVTRRRTERDTDDETFMGRITIRVLTEH